MAKLSLKDKTLEQISDQYNATVSKIEQTRDHLQTLKSEARQLIDEYKKRTNP